MGQDDYKSSGGGALKLKGPRNAGIDKKRKKEKKSKPWESQDVEGKPKANRDESDSEKHKDQNGRHKEENEDEGEGEDDMKSRNKNRRGDEGAGLEEEPKKRTERDSTMAGKTETERRHEEVRRRRLDERLKREGAKTHKERVEELNKYLSTLSEHHDMPRIGPG